MNDEERSRIADHLKRAFDLVIEAPRASSPGLTLATVRGVAISFTAPLLQAVLDGRKTQTRRPIRPAPTRVADGVPIGVDGSPIAPLCRAGDRLWVREKWARVAEAPGERFVYAIDAPPGRVRWVSSRFMPRAAARTFLTVSRVEVQRLNAITAADAEREGVVATPTADARAAFLALWDSIYGDGGFASTRDPWVWAVTFAIRNDTVTLRKPS